MGDNNIEAVSLLTEADAQIFKLCFWVGTEERRSVRLWRILAQLVSAFFFFQQSTFHTRYKALQANSSISNSRNTLNKTMGCKRKQNAGLGIRKKKRGKGTPAIPKEIITNRPPSSSQVSEISVASTTSSQESCPKEWYSGTQTCLFIKMIYEKKYQAAPESKWYAEGSTGIISLLLKDIPWTNCTTIKKVLAGSFSGLLF